MGSLLLLRYFFLLFFFYDSNHPGHLFPHQRPITLMGRNFVLNNPPLAIYVTKKWKLAKPKGARRQTPPFSS